MPNDLDLTGVPALTLLNPYAHLIAHGTKRVENRSWLPWAGVDRLFVHAGKRWADAHDLLRGHVDTSAIVALADLTGACNASRWTSTVACDCGEWAQPGQCHWQLANVVALPEPVAASGRQGLWRPDAAVVDAVQAQLVAVA